MTIDYKTSIRLECDNCKNTVDFVKVESVKFNAKIGKWTGKKSKGIFCSKCKSSKIIVYAFPEVNPLKI